MASDPAAVPRHHTLTIPALQELQRRPRHRRGVVQAGRRLLLARYVRLRLLGAVRRRPAERLAGDGGAGRVCRGRHEQFKGAGGRRRHAVLALGLPREVPRLSHRECRFRAGRIRGRRFWKDESVVFREGWKGSLAEAGWIIMKLVGRMVVGAMMM